MRFIRLPWRIHRSHPRWVPPLIWERKQFLDRGKNPYFEHGEAEYFIAWRGRDPVGRITAMVDRQFNDYHDWKWGSFGFFECLDDPEAARALIDAADAWVRERGCDRLVGPMDFTMNDEVGILIEGFDLRPMLKQPWHPPYYQGLMEAAGLEKAQDLLMWNLEVSDRVERPAGHRASSPPRSGPSTASRSATCARRTWRRRSGASSRSTTRPGRRTGASSRSPRRR